MATSRQRIIFGLIAVAFLIVVVTLFFIRVRTRGKQPEQVAILAAKQPTVSPTVVSTPSPSASPSEITSPSSTPSPSAEVTSTPAPVVTPTDQTHSYAGNVNLIVPVVGVRRDQLLDTFDDARSEGRVHDAIDIPAPANTPVIAAADGTIVKLFHSDKGGTTIYQASSDKKLIFYYAHLSGYADGIIEGRQVRQGETIAYVGDTGNAGPGNFHLHFSISIVSDPKRYWEGTNINPYPLLHR